MPSIVDRPRPRNPEGSTVAPVEQRIADPIRVAAVRATGLLDAPPSAVLDELCAAAAATLDADAVMVTLLDEDRQWFAGAYGLGEPWATTRQSDLPASLCQYIPAPDQPLAVLDLANDRTFSGSGAAALGVGSYLGYPLCTTEQRMLGALCAVRQEPSTWSDTDQASLRALAAVCERYLRREVITRHDPSHDLAMVAHDIRNPLTVLRGVASMLARVEDPQTRTELAAMVERAASRIDRLVEDLVTAGVPTAETVPVRRRRFDLSATVRDVIDGTRLEQGEIVVDLPDAAVIYADEAAMTRIVTNLLDNACRHGDPPVTVGVRTSAAEVVIEVTNTGTQIPEALRPHLFARFRPGMAATSGTGLGLHIVQRLAASHHGTVELVDHPTLTCLRVRLPQRPTMS